MARIISFLLASLLTGLSFANPPAASTLATLENGILAAINAGSHSILVQALEAHKSQILSEAGSILGAAAPGVAAAAGDIEAGAEMASAVASIIPAGAGVAAAAQGIEAIAAAVQHGAGAAPITAGGSASQAAKNSPLVQAALDAEKTAQAGTGIGSRTLAAIISVFGFGALGVKMYTDWFSTNSSSSKNENQQRVSAYISDIPTITALLGVSAGSGYYAIKNKWYNDTVAAAKVTTQAVTNHVNTVSDVLEQVKQKKN